jgi:Thioredoxin
MRKIKRLFIGLMMFVCQVHSFNRLDEKYCVYYGDKKAPFHVIQYYSFQCPHCLELFKTDFNLIQDKYISKGEIFWIFHPAPMDLLTLHGMHCLSHLSDKEKKVFLGAVLAETDLTDFDYSYQILVKAMEVLGKPSGAIKDPEDLKSTTTFQDASAFVLQGDKLNAVPHLEINGIHYPDQIPDLKFIDRMIQKGKK